MSIAYLNDILEFIGSPGYKKEIKFSEIIKKYKKQNKLFILNSNSIIKKNMTIHVLSNINSTIQIARLTIVQKINPDCTDKGELDKKNSILIAVKNDAFFIAQIDICPYPGRFSLWLSPLINSLGNIELTVNRNTFSCSAFKILSDCIMMVKCNPNEKWKYSMASTVLQCMFASHISETQNFQKIPTSILIPNFEKQNVDWDKEKIQWCWENASNIMNDTLL